MCDNILTNYDYRRFIEQKPDVLEVLGYHDLMVHACVAKTKQCMKQSDLIRILPFGKGVVQNSCDTLLEQGLLTRPDGKHYHAIGLTDALCDQIIDRAEVQGETVRKRNKAIDKAQRWQGARIIHTRQACQ